MSETIEMQENKVGETFVFEGKVFEVKDGCALDCLKCAFGDDDQACHKFRCTPSGREDGKWVHFEEVNNG